jgi:hypothetical protein
MVSKKIFSGRDLTNKLRCKDALIANLLFRLCIEQATWPLTSFFYETQSFLLLIIMVYHQEQQRKGEKQSTVSIKHHFVGCQGGEVKNLVLSSVPFFLCILLYCTFFMGFHSIGY